MACVACQRDCSVLLAHTAPYLPDGTAALGAQNGAWHPRGKACFVNTRAVPCTALPGSPALPRSRAPVRHSTVAPWRPRGYAVPTPTPTPTAPTAATRSRKSPSRRRAWRHLCQRGPRVRHLRAVHRDRNVHPQRRLVGPRKHRVEQIVVVVAQRAAHETLAQLAHAVGVQRCAGAAKRRGRRRRRRLRLRARRVRHVGLFGVDEPRLQPVQVLGCLLEPPRLLLLLLLEVLDVRVDPFEVLLNRAVDGFLGRDGGGGGLLRRITRLCDRPEQCLGAQRAAARRRRRGGGLACGLRRRLATACAAARRCMATT